MNSEKLRILYIGTGTFAIKPLEALVGSELVEVVGILTQPDKPVGRKQILTPGPLKNHIKENPDKFEGIPIFQPQRLKDESGRILAKTNPDLIIAAAYGQMIPNDMLEDPKYGAWNLHGSLLPKLRGAVPVQRAILDGLAETGVTIQRMVEELDAGDILLQESISIVPEDTTESLMDKLSVLASKMLIEAIQAQISGELEPVKQDEAEATFCYQSDISKDKAEVTAGIAVVEAERMVRGFYPWPIAWIKIPSGKYTGKRLKIYEAEILQGNFESGFDLRQVEGELILEMKDGGLNLKSVQLEGKDRKGGEEYLYLVS